MPTFASRAPWHTTTACVLTVLLAGCSVLKEPPRAAVYDFGAPAVTATSAVVAGKPQELPPLVLAQIGATQTLDSTALVYRLAYANDQQLRPYSLARWSAPPAELVRQRLRERLSADRTVLGPLDPGAALTLKIDLDEFSQLFTSADESVGLVRMNATLTRSTPSGEQPVAQRSVTMRRPAASADAAGGVQALTAATDAAADDLARWLKAQR
ncbi:MAG: ABC-type transport auxiliary lipoprotein family protein [Burkholderiaceae bacterium]